MNRITSVLLIGTALFGTAATAAAKEKIKKDGIEYVVTGKSEVKLDDAEGAKGSVVVPATITKKGKTYYVTEIGRKAFHGNKNVTEVALPSTVKEIDYKAFYKCESLRNLDLGNGVRKLGTASIGKCASLQLLRLPASLETLNTYAFVENVLTTIEVDPANLFFASQDGVLYDKSLTRLLVFPSGRVASEFAVPQGVTVIGEAAFQYNRYVSSIILPDGVLKIEPYAFSHCSILVSIYLPYGLTEIPRSMCYYSQNLTQVNIPASVVKIGENAFDETSLISIDLPASVAVIESDAFTKDILKINISAPVPPSFPQPTAEKMRKIQVTVPFKSGEKYSSHPAWGHFNIVEQTPPPPPPHRRDHLNPRNR